MRQVILSSLFVLSLLPAAAAGEIADLAAEAEVALEDNRGGEAVELMRQALVGAWQAAPMEVARAVFVAEPASGYGLYTARAESTFAAGEPLLIYLEPIGFEWKQEGELYSSLLALDFEIRLPSGEIVAGQKDFGQFAFTSHAPNVEYMSTVTLNLNGAPAGDYVLGLTLRDELGGESTEVDMPFAIR